MKPSEVKTGDWAVNVSNASVASVEKHKIHAISEQQFVIKNHRGRFIQKDLDDPDWSLEPNPTRLNTQTIVIEVPTKVVVTFEKTEIEHGEEFFIKTFELADLPQMRKEIEYQVRNLADPQADVVNVKWENQ